jgi:hypothetical protein
MRTQKSSTACWAHERSANRRWDLPHEIQKSNRPPEFPQISMGVAYRQNKTVDLWRVYVATLGKIIALDENVEEHGVSFVVAGDGQKRASLTLKEDGTLEIQGLFGRPITIKPMAKNLVALCFESPECV